MTETHTCTCKVCNGKAFAAPQGLISGSPKQVRAMVHNYAQYAHGTSPLAAAMRRSSGVQAV